MAKKRSGKRIKNPIKTLKIEKKENTETKYLLILFVLFALVSGLTTYIILTPKLAISKQEIVIKPFISLENSTLVSMKLPAVDNEGNGVVTTLTVEATPGSGRTLIDVDLLLFWPDTQQSIRVARGVAKNITNVNLSKHDLIYNIYANASLIGGPSAGSALAIATLAALENKSLNQTVMITGTVNHDGTLGPVSEILAKAKASKDVGAELFLVPLLQSRDVIYETRKHCEKYGYTEICTIEQIPKKIKVSEQVGIDVKEIETIRDALKYFIS